MAAPNRGLSCRFRNSINPLRPFIHRISATRHGYSRGSCRYGALVTSAHTRNRVMNVAARVGDYKLDSSNFISGGRLPRFIGPSGTVGIDRDYDSLRQDLWIATDQAFKEAVENLFPQAGIPQQPGSPVGH